MKYENIPRKQFDYDAFEPKKRSEPRCPTSDAAMNK
eukprot:CAMPEP_0178960958 /NCGR_PEP_ID=MMETSP0789-20121207/13332_1 /TAXON_ID=3005 /ORGANISM="Rhizosolenia setigera, Strain CCMP 1694" /LENGTH=35 /DNA_ID= /DNA_START= /DNA_END= /DNA_ORIENTATION=